MSSRRPRPTFFDYGRVRRQLGVAPATFRAMIADGTFPKPIDLRLHKKVFLVAELDAWFRTHCRGSVFPLDADSGPEALAS